MVTSSSYREALDIYNIVKGAPSYHMALAFLLRRLSPSLGRPFPSSVSLLQMLLFFFATLPLGGL